MKHLVPFFLFIGFVLSTSFFVRKENKNNDFFQNFLAKTWINIYIQKYMCLYICINLLASAASLVGLSRKSRAKLLSLP